ncbi:MAG: rod shape-determining protein MreC [Bacteroidales bacterium]|nr:rod shape-determining protein MreC [Bacteroidales bacterium]
MRSLLRFLIRYHTVLLFLILEIIAFILIANFGSYQKSRIYKFRIFMFSGIERKFDDMRIYFNLAEENKQLTQENARLRNLLPKAFYNPLAEWSADSLGERKYLYMPARVINNSTNRQYNYLIIDRGTLQGVEPEMAVICQFGIVGTVKECSANYSTVISVLNREFSPNVMIKRNGFYGPLEWPGRNYRRAIMNEIPTHADVEIGDTIVTSTISELFPPGILVGTVKDYLIEEGLFYRIDVELSTDYKKVSNVVLVKNLMHEEELMIRNSIEND